MKGLGTAGDESLRSVEESRIIEHLLFGGWCHELQAGGRASAVETVTACLARWVGQGLPIRADAAGRRLYDPVEVQNFMTRAGLFHEDPVWFERFVGTGRRLVRDFEEEGGCGEALPPRRFGVTLRRTYNLSSIRPGAPVRLRLPRPLEDETLTDLTLTVVGDPPVALDRAPGRLEARLASDGGTRSLAYRADFTARPGQAAASAELDADEVELYSRPKEGFIHATPGLSALARDLTAGCRGRSESIAALTGYVMETIRAGSIHYHDIDMDRPAEWVLDNGWCNCELGSALLVSLCRAVGIPARIVGGYLLYRPAPSIHCWAEVWDGGWRPFDLFAWGLSAGGRDPVWRDRFAGRLDYRMKTQIFPRTVLGPMVPRLPARWHILTEATADGARIHLADAESGTVLYTDEVSVGPPALRGC